MISLKWCAVTIIAIASEGFEYSSGFTFSSQSSRVTSQLHAETSLPLLFPEFAPALTALELTSPTPIQSASAAQTLNRENVMLIAPTGSGKSLAYVLPVLTHAMNDAEGTVVILAPTRELALQLSDVVASLLRNLDGDAEGLVKLAVRGVPPPSREALSRASVLVGTPAEVLVLVEKGEARDFIDKCTGVVLDEVDVLLPPPTKGVRTSLDGHKNQRDGATKMSKEQLNLRKAAQKRKIAAAKRDASSGLVTTPTESVLTAITLATINSRPPQILAGSATASRKTLDLLNRVLKNANRDSLVDAQVKVVRPYQAEESQESSRAITVPSEVAHRYVSISKEAASSADSVLVAIAKASRQLNLHPNARALLFICGEFGRANESPPTNQKPPPSRKKPLPQNVRKKIQEAKLKAKAKSGQPLSLSAKATCAKLSALSITAEVSHLTPYNPNPDSSQPLHVALGLEPNAAQEDQEAPFLVTFEDSARGLHLDNADAVFLLGRPKSASSYLHLSGRVGRSAPSEGGRTVRPGTIISFCSKGGALELQKRVKQIGGSDLEELVLAQ